MLRYDRQIKPGLVALYDIWPGNGAVYFYNPGAHTGLSADIRLQPDSLYLQQSHKDEHLPVKIWIPYQKYWKINSSLHQCTVTKYKVQNSVTTKYPHSPNDMSKSDTVALKITFTNNSNSIAKSTKNYYECCKWKRQRETEFEVHKPKHCFQPCFQLNIKTSGTF